MLASACQADGTYFTEVTYSYMSAQQLTMYIDHQEGLQSTSKYGLYDNAKNRTASNPNSNAG